MNSKQPRKQRKYLYKAPLHQKKKFVSSKLSDSLKEKYHRRSFSLREGDQVEVMRGQYEGTRGNISRVDLNRVRVYVDKVTHEKSAGGKVFYPLHPSNLMITRLNLDDSERKKILERT